MKTRQQYLNKECSHQEYYIQFANKSARLTLVRMIGETRIIESKDEAFNDIPLKCWDELPFYCGDAFIEAGDYPTLAGKVCMYKAIARTIRDEHKNKTLSPIDYNFWVEELKA